MAVTLAEIKDALDVAIRDGRLDADEVTVCWEVRAFRETGELEEGEPQKRSVAWINSPSDLLVADVPLDRLVEVVIEELNGRATCRQ